MTQLHRSFITPIDREDIALLAHALDDIADFVHTTAETLLIYNVEQPTDMARQLSDLIVEAVTQVEMAISQLHAGVEQKNVINQCVEINRLENQGDKLHRSLMGELFSDTTDIASLIKWREIYGYMEEVLDKCEEVADVLEGICIKYA
jgi:predicted phosphate transport protein (TIGR00153 family)